MGEAKRRKKLDPNFGQTAPESQIEEYQVKLSKKELINLNGFLGLVLGKLATKSANLIGDVEVSELQEIRQMTTYQELKAETEELLDYLENINSKKNGSLLRATHTKNTVTVWHIHLITKKIKYSLLISDCVIPLSISHR